MNEGNKTEEIREVEVKEEKLDFPPFSPPAPLLLPHKREDLIDGEYHYVTADEIGRMIIGKLNLENDGIESDGSILPRCQIHHPF